MSNPLVLLIEDDCRLCDTICDLLQLLEIDCRVARNDTISRASLVALKPDLILLDLPAHGRGGDSIVKDIRLDFRLRHTKLVLIAGDEYADAPECRLADAILRKPFVIGELEAILRHLLGQQRNVATVQPDAAFALQTSSSRG